MVFDSFCLKILRILADKHMITLHTHNDLKYERDITKARGKQHTIKAHNHGIVPDNSHLYQTKNADHVIFSEIQNQRKAVGMAPPQR